MYKIYERVSVDNVFKSEIGIIKRVLRELIKDHKIELIDRVYSDRLRVFDVPFTSDVPVEYVGDITTYSNSDYLMVGVSLSGFRVDMKKLSMVIAKDAFDAIKLFLDSLGQYGHDVDFIKTDYPVIWDCIESLGLGSRSGFSGKEVADIIMKLSTDYKPLKISNLDSVSNLVIKWQRGTNGLGIKDNDFMPVFIFDKISHEMYYFDKDSFSANFYYKTVKDLIKKKMLKEIDMDNMSRLYTSSTGNIGSPQICLLKHFGK